MLSAYFGVQHLAGRLVAYKGRQDNERTLAVSHVYVKFVMILMNSSSNFHFISFFAWICLHVYIRPCEHSLFALPGNEIDPQKNLKNLTDNLHLVNWFFSEQRGFFGLKSVLNVLSPRLQNFIISQIFEVER